MNRRLFQIFICASLPFLAISTANSAHVQWERDGIPHVQAPVFNPTVYDPDRGVQNLSHRRVEVRGLAMNFERMDHVEIEVFNNTPDIERRKSWVEIENVVIMSGFGKAERGRGFRNYYIQGNGPIMVDLVLRVSNLTDTNALAIKVTSPYRAP